MIHDVFTDREAKEAYRSGEYVKAIEFQMIHFEERRGYTWQDAFILLSEAMTLWRSDQYDKDRLADIALRIWGDIHLDNVEHFPEGHTFRSVQDWVILLRNSKR